MNLSNKSLNKHKTNNKTQPRKDHHPHPHLLSMRLHGMKHIPNITMSYNNNHTTSAQPLLLPLLYYYQKIYQYSILIYEDVFKNLFYYKEFYNISLVYLFLKILMD
eukprot:scaffold667_cov168-Ochromonas_danica.AAC.21